MKLNNSVTVLWKNQEQIKRNISLLEELHGNLIDLEKDLSSKHV